MKETQMSLMGAERKKMLLEAHEAEGEESGHLGNVPAVSWVAED